MKKNKILKILLIIILVILFILGCLTIYKFIIVNKIFNKMAEYVLIENYHMKITSTEEDANVTEVYYKNGIGKMVISDGIYSWTDGKKAYLVNENNKTYEELEMNSALLISNEYVGSIVPGYSKNVFEKFVLAGDLNTSIKTEKYDSIKYYMIKTNENELKKTIWFQYNTLIPTQVNIEIDGIKKSYNYDINFDNVTDKVIQKPNLEEYTIIE